MTPCCPSDLALEGYLFERTSSKYAPHVTACAPCRARVARMEEEGQQFLQYVYPATVGKVEEAAGGPRTSWKSWMLVLPIPAAAAMAALLVVVLSGGAPDPLVHEIDQTQIKGGGSGSLGLTVFLGAADGAQPIPEGGAIPTHSAIRFKVTPTKACWLWVVSVDAAGQVSRLYPTAGDAGAEIAQGGLLPGGAVLDGTSGPERVFAFCAPKPLAYATVERAVLGAVAQGEEAVRSAAVVPGLRDGTAQGSVLIEKKRQEAP
jgi:hypothetical protein